MPSLLHPFSALAMWLPYNLHVNLAPFNLWIGGKSITVFCQFCFLFYIFNPTLFLFLLFLSKAIQAMIKNSFFKTLLDSGKNNFCYKCRQNSLHLWTNARNVNHILQLFFLVFPRSRSIGLLKVDLLSDFFFSTAPFRVPSCHGDTDKH